MAGETTIARVAALWRFPVKSMRGECLDRAQIGSEGLLGDRAYALLDLETGRVVSATEVKRYPNLFGFRARYIDAPPAAGHGPAVMIELPGGGEVRSDDAEADAQISARLGRDVRLVSRDAAESGAEGNGAPFHDASPVSVLTNSTLQRMNELQPESVFDARRFRMNLILDCVEAGFPENAWVGRALKIGNETSLGITSPDARCVMTTLAQDELPEDRAILKGLARHNRIRVGEKGRYPCAGVYARVLAGGTVSRGDAVILSDR